MAKFIEVTDHQGNPLLLNTDYIVSVSKWCSLTDSTMEMKGSNTPISTKETFEEIKTMLEVVNE